MTTQYLIGDAVAKLKGLPAESVHFCMTSPPYWALRNYADLDGQHGLEKSPAEYVAQMMLTFDEVWRVLRDDGVCIVNMGDTYAGSGSGGGGNQKGNESGEVWFMNRPTSTMRFVRPKSLCLIPWRFAVAMTDRGWICRNVVPWVKTSSMPTSAKDRMKCRWEPCFVFTKSQKYYSDVEAVRAAHGSNWIGRPPGLGKPNPNRNDEGKICTTGHESGANPGDVLELGPQPSKLKHYAMYPVRLPLWFMRWLLPRKVCEVCGQAWTRETKRGAVTAEGGKSRRYFDARMDGRALAAKDHTMKAHAQDTLGWRPACTCNADTAGPIVLDPYSGPGTTACAAEWLWTHPAEGFDSILANPRTVPTRPGKKSKFHDGDGSQRPEYAKARMVKVGERTTVLEPWQPGKALMIDLDPQCEKLHLDRKAECWKSLGKELPVKSDTPLFAKEKI